MLREEVVEHLGDELLLGLGELGDGIELSFEARGWAALAGCTGEHLADQQFIERKIEPFVKAWKKIGSDADAQPR